MNTNKYNLGDQVELIESNEVGTVIALAFYQNTPEVQYFLRYKCADGRLTQDWWGESAIKAKV